MKESDKIIKLIDSDHDTELIRFTDCGYESGFFRHSVNFRSLGEAEWSNICNNADPRDVPWQFEFASGERTHFSSVSFTWEPKVLEFRYKYRGFYSPVVPRSWMEILIGRKEKRVLQERAPLSWKTFRLNRVKSLLASQVEEDVASGLSYFSTCYVTKDQVRWSADQLARFLKSNDTVLLVLALDGFNELARVNGWYDALMAETIKDIGRRSSSKAVQHSSKRAYDALCNFGHR